METKYLVRDYDGNIIESNIYYRKYISYIDEDYIEVISAKSDIRLVQIYYHCIPYLIEKNNIPKEYIYNENLGAYIHQSDNISHTWDIRSYWGYGHDRCYNFSKLDLSYFPIPKFKLNKVIKDLFPFTYGFEFETSKGRIPSEDCFKYNLVPLFDGSISGYEYVTFPVNSENVLDSIHINTSLLFIHTIFNKDCSIHIHIGGFPISINSIKLLLRNWYKFQIIIKSYLPDYIYNTEYFKTSRKSYCQAIGVINFNSFYSHFTGNKLIDDTSLYLPNQYDDDENHKWTVQGRYFNMNIMHLISGKDHKTIEFRFLHPTTHEVELQVWTIILSAFVKYTINVYQASNFKCVITLDKVLNLLPDTLRSQIKSKLEILNHLSKIQHNFGDPAGINNKLKDDYFKLTNFDDSLCVD